MRGSQYFSTGRKSFLFLLLPIIIVFLVIQAITVFGQDELLRGDGSPAQVGASKTVSSAELPPGGTVRYTIVISNSGGTEASGMNMTDTLPAEFSVVSAQVASLNNATGPTVDVVNDVVTWNGTLGATTGEVQIEINAALTDTAVFGSIITNTAQVTGSGPTLSPAAAVEVVDEYKIYMPLVFKPLEVPALLSVGVPTSSDGFANYSMLVSWENLNDPSLTYELQESADPSFSNPKVYNPGNAASFSVNHAVSTNFHFYYRVRAVRTSQNLYSDWSNTLLGYGAYRDTFNDSSTGWRMRREDTDDTNNSVNYQGGRLRVKIGGRWDSMIASPMVATPVNWSGYRIKTSVELGEGIDYLHSYGIVFGGDWNGTTPCPNSNFSSCFNRYYRLNVIWQGDSKPFLVHLKRIDSHNTSNNTDTGVTLMSYRDVNVSNPNGFNNWTIDVRNNGTIELYVNGNKFYTATDTNYVAGGRYFGTFASADAYLGTAAYYEYYQVEPLP